MDQLSLPGFSSPGDKRQPCKNCGKPTTSQYGYCKTNPECKLLWDRAAYGAGARYKRKHPVVEARPCGLCGRPTASQTGFCFGTPECRHAYFVARRGGNQPTTPCKNCGKPTRSSHGYCTTTRECDRAYQEARRGGNKPTTPCGICGKPTTSQTGICNRTRECGRAFKDARRWGSPPTAPCLCCGEPTRSRNGYCNRTPTCHAKYVAADAMTGICKLCGGPVWGKSKYRLCQQTEQCRKASRAAAKEAFLAAHPGYEARARYRRRKRRTLAEASKRAAQTGIPFSLTEADLPLIPDACPVFGTPFYVPDGTTKGGPVASSLDLDKIIPELGYVPGNVQWISHKANLMKRDATPAELIKFADWIYATFRPVPEG